jgi:cytochrome c-type biogenesis protein CcsB
VVDVNLAQTSDTLFNLAFLAYVVAMVAYFFRLAFTRVSVEGTPVSTKAGDRVGALATMVATGGAMVHLVSLTARGVAMGRVPWANMYEYSSVLAVGTVLVGLVVVQRKFGYGHLMGFVLALALLSMASAAILYTEAGPVVPALNSYWITIHTSAAMAASSIFIVGFAATALYLVKDTAEQRLAAQSAATYSGSTVGAAEAPEAAAKRADGARGADAARGAVAEHRPTDHVEPGTGTEEVVPAAMAQRDTLSPIAFPVIPFIVVALFVFTVWRAPLATLIAGSVAALLGTATWYAVPFLPPAARLDNLSYRIIAFAFPIWTFAVLAGAIWAQEAWGRYWGWDPKETGSFFTWVLYAGYLHARSTRGWRGRGAGWIGVAAFVALMVTYYAVNLFVVGLHSYAGV